MSEKKEYPRTSVYINEHLKQLRDSGAVRAGNFSEQLDRLAQRYIVLVDNLLPARMSAEDWSKVIVVVREMSGEFAADAASIPFRLRHINKQRHPIGDVSSLAIRLEQMKLPELLAVQDLAERLIHAGSVAPDEIKAWLAENHIGSGPVA